VNKLPKTPPLPGTMLRVKKSSRKKGYPNETALIIDSKECETQELRDKGDKNITLLFKGRAQTAPWAFIRENWGRNWEVLK